MKVAIIGTGYVGLPTGVGLAELGHDVVCIDRELKKIQRLQQGQVTLYEQGLDALLQENFKRGKIRFTCSMEEGITDADVVIIAVGTPPHPVTHEADLKYIYAAAAELSIYLGAYTVVAIKSTVPVGTGDSIETLLRKTNKQADVDVVSLPEFLREGFAVYDFFNPDRIIVGVNTSKARTCIEKLYAPLLERSPKTKMMFVNRYSSETIKYAANSFLATKIHFINEMADFCEKTGANIYEVAEGIGLDSRIGKAFLKPGPGYGGSCFPKDTMALVYMAQQNDVDLSIIRSTIEGNNKRIENMALRIIDALDPEIERPIVGVLGLAFKSGTDDCRVSPAMQILAHLGKLNHHIRLRVYDPKAMDVAKEVFGERINHVTFCSSMDEVAVGADAVAVLTEWPEFKDFNLVQAHACMRHHSIIDCRNMLSPEQAKALGFSYKGIGLVK